MSTAALIAIVAGFVPLVILILGDSSMAHNPAWVALAIGSMVIGLIFGAIFSALADGSL